MEKEIACMQVFFYLEEPVPTVRLQMTLLGSELEMREGPLTAGPYSIPIETLHPQQTRPQDVPSLLEIVIWYPDDQRSCENSDFISLWSLLEMSGLSTLNTNAPS